MFMPDFLVLLRLCSPTPAPQSHLGGGTRLIGLLLSGSRGPSDWPGTIRTDGRSRQTTINQVVKVEVGVRAVKMKNRTNSCEFCHFSEQQERPCSVSVRSSASLSSIQLQHQQSAVRAPSVDRIRVEKIFLSLFLLGRHLGGQLTGVDR